MRALGAPNVVTSSFERKLDNPRLFAVLMAEVLGRSARRPRVLMFEGCMVFRAVNLLATVVSSIIHNAKQRDDLTRSFLRSDAFLVCHWVEWRKRCSLALKARKHYTWRCRSFRNISNSTSQQTNSQTLQQMQHKNRLRAQKQIGNKLPMHSRLFHSHV